MPKKTKTLLTFILFTINCTSLFSQIPAGYYDSAAELSGQPLKTALHDIIDEHVEYPYTSSGTDLWDILKQTDKDTANSDNVILIYSGWSVNAEQEYNDGNGWSREHVWAKSRGDFGNDPPAGTDAHHLRPCDILVNSARNNRWFDYCSEPYYNNGINTGSFTSSTNWVWQPRDEVVGDVARMMFYMATRYEGDNGEPDLELIDYIPSDNYTNAPIHAKLSTLLAWHEQDPVDDFETNRNDIIYSFQENRNPFIDHPEYINLIWNNGILAPSDLIASYVTYDSVTLAWTYNSDDELGFKIFQDDSLITTTEADVDSYTVTNLKPGTAYRFSISAFNNNQESPKTELVVYTLTNYSDIFDKVFFSEYIEGSSWNKALEIYNGTGFTVNLADYSINLGRNGEGWGSSLDLAGYLENEQTYVICHAEADEQITAAGDFVSSSGINFNGNDALGLFYNDSLIDVIGYPEEDPGNGWDIAGIPEATKDYTLVRKPHITSGNNVWANSAGTNSVDSEWIVYEEDTFEYIGAHTVDVGIEDEEKYNLAENFYLFPCYPNPFNNSTLINYSLSRQCNVEVNIYNLNGQLIENLLQATQNAGNYYIRWNAQNIPSGVYLYHLQAGSNSQLRKCILMK